MSVKKCVLCAQCSYVDAAYRLTKEERRSPRHAVWQLLHKQPSRYLYGVLLNGLSEAVCPVGVKIDEAVLEGRRALVKKGVMSVENRKFIEKIKKGKNPYK